MNTKPNKPKKKQLRRGVKCDNKLEFNLLHSNVAGLKNAKHSLRN